MAIETPIQESTAEFTLTVEGTTNQDGFQVYSFTVDRLVNKIPMAKIVILDGDIADQDYSVTSGNDFVPGKKVTLQAGTVDLKETIFEGIITTQKIAQNAQGTSLEITAKDVAVRMTVGRKNEYYINDGDDPISDDDILAKVIQKYSEKGITADIETAKFQVLHNEMVQYYSTDWDFLVTRAEASARMVIVEDGTVSVKTPTATFNQANFALVFGENTYSFEAEMDGRNEYSDVTAKSWNWLERKLEEKAITDQVDKIFTTEGNITPETLAEDVIDLEEFTLQHGGNLKAVELEQWAYSKMLRSRLSKIRGTAMVAGTYRVKPGDNITVSKFTPRFNGTAYVSGIRHEMSGDSTWFTHIQFGYKQEWFYEKYNDIVDKPAAGLLPAVNGLMVGVVTGIKDEDDPDSNHRVRVRMPLVSSDSKGVWARVASLDAGTDHGVFFRPEVGDEVILGFLDDDPREPVILGSLFSAEKATPAVSIAEDDQNHEKGIFTKSGLQLVFNDDPNEETISIQTKDGDTVKNSIVINATEPSVKLTDDNGNKIEMTKDGITIESAKNINLTTKSGDVLIDGVNMEMKATGELKAEANAKTEIKSSGLMDISGATVQIN